MTRHNNKSRPKSRLRRGVVVVIVAVAIAGMMSFIALSVDTAVINLTHARMQTACDAASLAASQEIVSAVESAGDTGEDPDVDANSIAIGNAKQTAVAVAAANGVYIDPDRDIQFGKRTYDESTGGWTILWGEEPYNTIRVQARRDQNDLSLPDGRLPLSFGWAAGIPSMELVASASAFVEARDIVVVLDFSSSMNDDSELKSIGTLGQSNVEANLEAIWNALGPPNTGSMAFEPSYPKVPGQAASGGIPHVDVTFKLTEADVESTMSLNNVVLIYSDGNGQVFYPGTSNGTFAGTGNHQGKTISRVYVNSGANDPDGDGYGERFDFSVSNIKKAYGLDQIAYPYPSGSWDDFIVDAFYDSHVQNAGYQGKWGGMLWMDYLLEDKNHSDQTPDLWKTPHYPFHAVKNGVSLLASFLEDLNFGDEFGVVSYDEQARFEDYADLGNGTVIDISADPITSNYAAVDTIQRRKQAGHYYNYTGIGYGIAEAQSMINGHIRYGARPTIILMTDGNANRYPSGWSLPEDFNWDDWTDYDGDGTADYTTTDKSKQYAFWQATQSIGSGSTMHTMSVGASADRNLMKAIAFAGEGEWIDIPGGSTVAEMEADMLEAFSKIAAKVPPAKIVYEDGASE